jgi:hypothetical protein
MSKLTVTSSEKQSQSSEKQSQSSEKQTQSAPKKISKRIFGVDTGRGSTHCIRRGRESASPLLASPKRHGTRLLYLRGFQGPCPLRRGSRSPCRRLRRSRGRPRVHRALVCLRGPRSRCRRLRFSRSQHHRLSYPGTRCRHLRGPLCPVVASGAAVAASEAPFCPLQRLRGPRKPSPSSPRLPGALAGAPRSPPSPPRKRRVADFFPNQLKFSTTPSFLAGFKRPWFLGPGVC